MRRRRRRGQLVPTYSSFSPTVRSWIDRHQRRLQKLTDSRVWRSEAIRDPLEHTYHQRQDIGVP